MECGLRLERLPAQDMFDVTHYFFEIDNLGTKEEQDAKLDLRRLLYRDLYERRYTWMEAAGTAGGSGEFGTQEVGADVAGAAATGPKPLSHKPYVPPTPVNPTAAKPFGDVLDAPLG